MIRAAMTLIAEKGVARTTLADVGVAAGYSRGLPVERFGTKLGLLNALIDSADSWFAVRAPEQIGAVRGLAAVRRRIAAHVESGLSSPTATRLIYYLYIEASFGLPELRPRMQALSQTFARGFHEHLLAAREDGEIAPDADCDRLATAIVGMIRGVFMEWVLSDGATDLRALTPLLQDMATVAIASPASPGTYRMNPDPDPDPDPCRNLGADPAPNPGNRRAGPPPPEATPA